MKKTKLFALPLLMVGLLGLSACSLFDDSDMQHENHYNPPSEDYVPPEKDPNGIYIGDVKAKDDVEGVNNVYFFQSLCYAKDGKITNTYKSGGANENEFNVNGGEDFKGTKANNNYDLCVPKSELANKKHVIILFIHGGAWVSGLKTTVNPYVHEFANRGYITATVKYTLLKESMDDPSRSIFRNLDEIDACITNIKESLVELFQDRNVELDANNQLELVIGGASSGAHLTMLYSYSRGHKATLKPKLVVNAVGPTDIKPAVWKKLATSSEHGPESIEKDSGNSLADLTIASTNQDGKKWDEYNTMRIANGMCGMPYTLEQVRAATEDESTISDTNNEAYKAMTKANGGEDQLSVTHYITAANKIPMVAAYAGMDTVVGINQFANLQTALEDNGYVRNTDYDYYYFRDSGHTQIDAAHGGEVYTNFVNKIDERCAALRA